VRERIEYRFKVSSAAVFTLYSYYKALEYRFRVLTADSVRRQRPEAIAAGGRRWRPHKKAKSLSIEGLRGTFSDFTIEVRRAKTWLALTFRNM
jgi:hypothetical protein